MAQQKIKIDNIEIWQPDKNMGYRLETTYTSDSTRLPTGVWHGSPMFTVDQYAYEATDVPAAEVSRILQLITERNFLLYRYSPYHGTWRSDYYKVGEGDLSIGQLVDGDERFDKLKINFTSVNPLSMMT